MAYAMSPNDLQKIYDYNRRKRKCLFCGKEIKETDETIPSAFGYLVHFECYGKHLIYKYKGDN